MFLLTNAGVPILTLLIQALAVLAALFIAMPFHEFAHAFTAKREGDFTAVAQKRYTLAPFSHIDKIGFLCLFFFGFGWAKPVPVDSRNFKRGRLSGFLVSIAGILTNLILGTIFLFLYMLVFKLSPSFYFTSTIGEIYYYFFQASIMLNFSLAFFNILPIYPLDGYRICESFSKGDSTLLYFLRRYSLFIYILLMLTGVYGVLYNSVMGSLIDVLHKLFTMILGL